MQVFFVARICYYLCRSLTNHSNSYKQVTIICVTKKEIMNSIKHHAMSRYLMEVVSSSGKKCIAVMGLKYIEKRLYFLFLLCLHASLYTNDYKMCNPCALKRHKARPPTFLMPNMKSLQDRKLTDSTAQLNRCVSVLSSAKNCQIYSFRSRAINIPNFAFMIIKS